MRWTHILTSALLPWIAAGKKANSNDRFSNYQAKQSSLAGPIKLTDASYDQLTKGTRDYSVTVLLNALDPRFSCSLCVSFQPEWELLAKSWIKGDKKAESKLVFGVLDFLDGKSAFQALGLQTAPVVVFFPPTVGPNAKPEGTIQRFDFGAGIERAEQVHAWVARQLPHGPHPRVVRPINYAKIGVTITAVLGLITFLSVASPYLLPIIQNRNLWAAFSLIAVLLFTSGQMYNHIRGVPYVGRNSGGGPSYFAGGFQNQFGLETQIVAAMYGVLAFATISLALKVPRIADSRIQQIAIFAWTAVLLAMYSFLLSVFRVKNGGYPFWLPPF